MYVRVYQTLYKYWMGGGVHYTVYGTKKSDNGRGEAESIIAFLSICGHIGQSICGHIGQSMVSSH